MKRQINKKIRCVLEARFGEWCGERHRREKEWIAKRERDCYNRT
ncbi:hypothetical protein PMN51_09745 [Blautia wexlerae]|nr:hypothetical protein [Blautia wexlerae]